MSVQIRQKNPRWMEQFKTRLKQQCKEEVAVGFPKEAGKAISAHYENGASVLVVAVLNNFGTETIPRRPFMDNAAHKLQENFKNMVKATQKKVNSGELTPRTVLKAAGLESEGIVRDEITNGNFVPNSPATADAKGSSRPLIDSGDMRKYVTSVVRGRTR